MRWTFWRKRTPEGVCGERNVGSKIGGRTPVCELPAGHKYAHSAQIGGGRCTWNKKGGVTFQSQRGGKGSSQIQAGGNIIIEDVRFERFER